MRENEKCRNENWKLRVVLYFILALFMRVCVYVCVCLHTVINNEVKKIKLSRYMPWRHMGGEEV
jgi:hypothetical protein